jgi:hypothetical protein
LALKVGPSLDFVACESSEPPPVTTDAIISLGVPVRAQTVVIHFEGDLEAALAAAFSSVRGSSNFVFDAKKKALKMTTSAP